MPDRYEALRAAFARRDEGGRRWTWTASGRDGSGGYPQTVIREGDVVLICTCYDTPDEPAFTAPYIAEADPTTVRALLDERDRLRAALEEIAVNGGQTTRAIARAALEPREEST